jgi:hypothetical protein
MAVTKKGNNRNPKRTQIGIEEITLVPSNSKCLPTLIEFIVYCGKHPEQRFWQALRNFADVPFIYVSNNCDGGGERIDTFYWQGRNK